jgi:antitoxin VapB
VFAWRVVSDLYFVDMDTAKIFQHEGSQAVLMPEAFRFEGSEVLIARHGDEVILKPMPVPKFGSFAEIAAYLAEKFPGPDDFPEPPPRPRDHERPLCRNEV